MAHPTAPARGSPPYGAGGPPGPQGGKRTATPRAQGGMGHGPGPQPSLPGTGDQPAPAVEVEAGPPEKVYPCGCAWPGAHKSDCMWSLWEQMRDNYLKTCELMGKFMTQANSMQEAAREGAKCECPAGCHGTDLGAAMGLQQMAGVTLPWAPASPGMPGPGLTIGQPPVENEARKLMEEQRRIKNTWVQFLNIFDMALDMANDVSKDRWEQNRRRKERQRLEREQRLEEMRKERLERQKGSKPEPPADKEKAPDKKDDKPNEKPAEKPVDKPKEETPVDDQPTEPPADPVEPEPTPADEQPAKEPAAEEEEEEG